MAKKYAVLGVIGTGATIEYSDGITSSSQALTILNRSLGLYTNGESMIFAFEFNTLYSNSAYAEAPDISGYDFDGWYTTNGDWALTTTWPTSGDVPVLLSSEKHIDGNVIQNASRAYIEDSSWYVIYPKYTQKIYFTITFQGNGGTPSSRTVRSEPGSRINLPSVSWGSYRFLGWYDGNTRVGGIGDAYTTPSANKILVAKWFKRVSGGDITFNFILNSGVQFNNDQPINPVYSSKVVGSYEIYISDDNRYCINWSVDTSEFEENGRKYTYILECKCAWTRSTADSQYFGTKTLSGTSGSGVDLSEVGFSSFAANVEARFRTVYGDSLRYVESGYLAYNPSSGSLRYGKQYAVDPIVPHP